MPASSDAPPPRVLVVVPARYASQRFPGKPLAPLCGPDGVSKPLIQWSWEAAMAVQDRAQIMVATDDPRIADVVHSFAGAVAMTATDLRNGTERCAALLEGLDEAPDLVINLQGDSPLIPRAALDALIDAWIAAPAPVLTPWIACDTMLGGLLVAEHAAGRIGGTTVVADHSGQALYFSKRPIPYGPGEGLKLHLGLYAYTPDALRRYAALPPGPLELAEGLEQLRFLEQGIPIRLVEVARPPAGFWEVNNPEDVALVERALAARA
ncbi:MULTISPECIES: 3-deoxy-manno-octulosonate cytidylyltransferase [unclassified Sphingomonas]|uniref:3-deoxy-manno-octulosonate cytidylyltransferase n=1 Tax=unclassified Sphingomonas TaxID=196159 RepID=UPI000A5E92D5|nr:MULTISPECIES: 3-deoxy-manno-octulosonate cytidylyltransferase [unclassified Sphingomonas]